MYIYLSSRVGEFSGERRSSRPPRERPLIVQDEYGRELYRYAFCDNSYLKVLNINVSTPGYGGSRAGSSSYGGGSDNGSYMDRYPRLARFVYCSKHLSLTLDGSH